MTFFFAACLSHSTTNNMESCLYIMQKYRAYHDYYLKIIALTVTI